MFTLTLSVKAQFYNGLNMPFGKNRLQFNKFYWQYYRFNRFDVYFSEYGNNLAQYTESYVNQELKRMEYAFDYVIDKRIIFIVYNRLSDFRQSNIGLVTGNDDSNTGGVVQIIHNKVSLYYEGDHKAYEHQISIAIAQIIINQLLNGSDKSSSSSTALSSNIPEWYTKGLASYMTDNWNVDIDDKVKDGILNDRFKHINRLTGNDAEISGHSLWKFIEKTYGKRVIPNIIYLTRVEKDINKAFLNVTGNALKDIIRNWQAYYYLKFKDYKQKSLTVNNLLVHKPRKDRVYQNIRISPDGKYTAYVTNDYGQYRIWLYSAATKKTKCIIKRENQLIQIPDYSFPLLAWHPSGKLLSFITEEKGGLKLTHYNTATREFNIRNFLYLEKVLDFAYSPDGSKLVLSGVHNGITDIYVHTLASSTNEQITNDLADDIQPHFLPDSKHIIFSSNRNSDSINTSEKSIKPLSPIFNLCISKYPTKQNNLVLISSNKYANQKQSIPLSSTRFIYLGDDNGIINSYIANYDSVISFVDTTVHFQYYTTTYPITDELQNILQQDIQPQNKLYGKIFLHNNKNYIIESKLSEAPVSNLSITEYRKEIINAYKLSDSLSKQQQILLGQPNKQKNKFSNDSINKDDSLIDIAHYVFEIEKLNSYKELDVENIPSSMLSDTAKITKYNPLQLRIYQTAFYPNYIVSQVYFSFLNTSYQPFTGGGVYFNPGFNLQFKLGAIDLLEDYKITGGMRLSTDFQSNEYLISFENLKKRIDKQMVFHRQTFKSNTSDGYFLKTTSQDAFFVFKIPFSQVLAFKATTFVRYDMVTTLASYGTNINPLEALDKPTLHNFWTGFKTELVFDNTRPLGINVQRGSRFKIFAEAYKQVNPNKSDLFVLGADFRHYQVIHRNIILASRLAGSSSFGGNRLVYYLGAVDNWINLTGKIPTFDNSVPIDQKAKYAYQTIATNMRGFSQNIRNGNNFAVINNEIRFPFIKYFSNYPIKSTFWSSIQAISFFDIGSAWTGWTPYSGGNGYSKNTIPDNGSQNLINTPVVVELESNRSPFVYGYGFGLHASIMGYFMRFDYAWGVDRHTILPPVFYLSFSQDF